MTFLENWEQICQGVTGLSISVFRSRDVSVARAVAPYAVAVNPRLRRWPAARAAAALVHECGHILWTWPAWTDDHARVVQSWPARARDILNVLEDRRVESALAEAGWTCEPLRAWVTANEVGHGLQRGWTPAGALAVAWGAGSDAVPRPWRAWVEAVWGVPLRTLDDALILAEAADRERP